MVFGGVDIPPPDTRQQTCYKILTCLKYLAEITLVALVIWLFPKKDRQVDTNMLINTCLVLMLISYLISACHKNVIWRCIRCVGLRTHGTAAIASVILTKATQIALLIVYLKVTMKAEKQLADSGFARYLNTLLFFRSFNRLFSAPFACAIETFVAL